MTTPMSIKLDCPCCGRRFESDGLASMNQSGTATDFRPVTIGSSPLPFYIHACSKCGYAGFERDFETIRISDHVKRMIEERLTPSVDDEGPFAGRRYEHAAWIKTWQGEPKSQIAHLYHMAAWCCVDDDRPREEEYYRRRAVENYEAAMGEGSISGDQIPEITYLIGELYRRIGEGENASRWFDRVAQTIGEDGDTIGLVDRARKQKIDPDEFF
jgi:uncharacterized protein (DUF2225 family)